MTNAPSVSPSPADASAIRTDAAPRHRVPVALGGRAYDVVVGPGALDALAEHAARLFPRRRAVVVADATALTHHGDALHAALSKADAPPQLITLAPGEASKSWRTLERVCDALLAQGIERHEAVVAFGGGVAGDLAGFAAAIVKRGTPFVQIPTTLLAQVDSSVGGKTAINSAGGKNMIGAFHQPSLVIADTALLQTLPPRDVRAGFAEVIKIAAVMDAEFFAWLETQASAILAQEPAALAEAVARAVTLKAQIVVEDEREAGRRALLNFGHTFGHALEAAAGYDSGLRHGEAVAAGMGLAAGYAHTEGLCAPAEAERLTALITAAGLAASARALPGAPFDADAILGLMTQDKKTMNGHVRLVLPRRIGAAEVTPVRDTAPLRRFLAHAL